MLRRFLQRFVRDDAGATAVEYGVMAALMFLAIVGALGVFGSGADGLLQATMNTLRTAIGG